MIKQMLKSLIRRWTLLVEMAALSLVAIQPTRGTEVDRTFA
jgi:hypothetical protein